MLRHLLLIPFILIATFSKAQWNPTTTVNLQLASLQSGDVISAATSTGGTFIAYYTSVSGNFNMMVQYLDAQGNKQFGPDGIVINNLATGSATYVFNAMVDKQNNFIVAYNDQRSGSNGTVINKVTTSGTLPWGMNGIYLGPGLSPYAAQLTTGEIIVAWNNSSNRISYQKISTAGATVWSPAKEVLPITSGRQISRVQLVPLTTGKFGMVFQQRNGTFGSPTPTTLFEQQFDNDGTALWGAPVALSNYVTANYTYYSVLSFNDTTYVGYYANPASQNRFDAFLQRVNADGSLPWGINGSDFATDPTPYEMGTSIAYSAGTSQVWAVSTFSNSLQTQYGIFVQKFNASTGARLLTDNAKPVIAINANGEQQKGALDVYNGTDPMFMFYDVTNKLYATRLDNLGNFVWPTNKVELGGSATSKLRFNFSTIVNNQAVAVWAETRPPAAFDQPYAQNITVNGTTGPLPVTLTSFRGILIDNSAQLSWLTQTENNNSGFFLQRSQDGLRFLNVTFVASKAVSGNSNSVLNYSYTDKDIPAGGNYYRLKQVDKDGRFLYSNIVLITRKFDHFVIVNAYPYPVSTNFTIVINSPVSQNITVSVFDAEGQLMKKKVEGISIGINTIVLDLSGLAKGNYNVILDDNTGEVKVLKMVKIAK